MPHPLVDQLRFARSEFERGLRAVPDPQAQQRFAAMNCLSWIVGHLAWQEQRYWLFRAQGQMPLPDINERFAYGAPACTPPVEESWAALHRLQKAADPWLDSLTNESLCAPLADGFSNVGTYMQRMIYHYWYHLGEGMAIRQMLGETGLPDFVGNIDAEAPYRPESQPGSGQLTAGQFLQEVRRSYQRWEELVAQAGEARLLEPVEGGWSLKDFAAHLAWYENEILTVLKGRVYTGSDLWGLPHAERNQRIFEQNRSRPLAEVLSEARAIHRQLEQELEKITDEDLHQASRFAQMPPDFYPWQVLAENSYQHYYDHLSTIQRWLQGE